MLKPVFSFLLFLFLCVPSILAQSSDLFIFREFQNAVKKGTRTFDGVPGEKYWTNSANYKLKASIEPVTGRISGSGVIDYSNNSPDDIKNLVLNLYPDVYKKGAPRNVKFQLEDITDGMIISELKINGIDVPPAKIQRNKAIGFLKLAEPIKSGTKLKLEVKWEFTMPKNPDDRIGSYGDSSYFVAYWYPQVAVYDDISGWDMIGYDGEHEFYTDNNSFDVELNVPNGILVWATGDLKNGEEIYTKECLNKLNKLKNSDEVAVMCEPGEVKNLLLPGKSHTWKFSANDVPDFSFSVANSVRWEATNLKLENGKRNILISSVYAPGDSLSPEVLKLSKHIIKYFSEVFPAVPYPYNYMTVFNGSGGMEFPMMVNQSTESDRWLTTYVTTHEIAHMYFPFLTGTNEKRFSWMDEGMAVYLPLSEQTNIFPGLKYDEISAANLSKNMGTQSDVPLMVPSTFVYGPAHMMGAYSKSGIAFLILEDIIGKDVMRTALQNFIKTWKHKHPTPYDFFFSINKSSGKNLDWFWKPWFFEFGYPSLILNESEANTKRKFEVIKKGNCPVPIHLEIEYTDGSKETITRTAEVWKNGEKSVTFDLKGNKEVKKISLGSPKIPNVLMQ